MQAKQVIKNQLETAEFLLLPLLQDLSDADLLVRPVPGANHIAWQFGHLINAEAGMQHDMPGAVPAELPPDFAANHNKEAAAKDGPDGFLSKEKYLELYKSVRAATHAALEKISDADLAAPNTGRSASFAPTVCHLMLLPAGHVLMHIGQFSVVRRKLNKPVLF